MIPLPATPTLTIPEAGKLLGIGRDAAYRAAESGELPTLRFGRRIVVPTAKLLALLGLDAGSNALATPPEVSPDYAEQGGLQLGSLLLSGGGAVE